MEEIRLSGKIVRKRINGRMVEVLVPSGNPMKWDELVRVFKRHGKH
jgi:predicted transcriptional regulator